MTVLISADDEIPCQRHVRRVDVFAGIERGRQIAFTRAARERRRAVIGVDFNYNHEKSCKRAFG